LVDRDKARRAPRQSRSKEMVEAILQAGLLVLREEGPERLTTKRIAERAGVSVGSLYRYFADKEEVLEAVYRRQHEEFWNVAVSWVPRLAALPLDRAVELIVDAALSRHRQLHALHPKFFREHSIRFTVATFNPGGADRATEWVAMILACHRGRLATPSPERAAYLMTRAIGGMLVATLRERPRYLGEPGFRDELVRMAMALVARPAGAAAAAAPAPEHEPAGAEAEPQGPADRGPGR
jgi:AcrR family transcriptional regulator